jgi:sulfide:quinone oxidoreductase
MKKITIIGAGFAALTAVRKLRKQDKIIEITLIAPRAEFHYLPGMIWIPGGLRKREDLVVPLMPFFKRMNVQYHAASVTGLSADGREVQTDQGVVRNDGLLIATG